MEMNADECRMTQAVIDACRMTVIVFSLFAFFFFLKVSIDQTNSVIMPSPEMTLTRETGRRVAAKKNPKSP